MLYKNLTGMGMINHERPQMTRRKFRYLRESYIPTVVILLCLTIHAYRVIDDNYDYLPVSFSSYSSVPVYRISTLWFDMCDLCYVGCEFSSDV